MYLVCLVRTSNFFREDWDLKRNMQRRWLRKGKKELVKKMTALGLLSGALFWGQMAYVSAAGVKPLNENNVAGKMEEAEESIRVNGYIFSGELPLAEDKLLEVVAEYLGRQATLTDLNAQADKLTQFLRSQGFFVAFAYIPPQDFTTGMVEIRIVPGYYGNITLNNETYIDDEIIRREMGIKQGAKISRKDLERGIWLTGDLSKVEAKTQLKRGTQSGTSDLVIEVKPKGNRLWGFVGVDNGGYLHTGRYQYSAFANYASPFGRGDQLSVGGVISNRGTDMWTGAFTYTTPFAAPGNKLGFSYAKSDYVLGGPFSALGYTGNADIYSLWWQHNFERSRRFNLYGTLRFDWKKLDTYANEINFRDPKSSRNWSIGINGDSLDTFASGGKNTFSLTYTGGNLTIDDAVQRAVDSITNKTEGHFGKYNLGLTRLQRISDRLALFLSYNRQWAEKNLDSSEKMSLGGPYAVRAYPVGEAAGDDGWQWTTEFRWNVPTKEGDENTWQLIAFVDGGHINQYHEGNVYGGRNSRSLYGAGIGVNWSNQDNWAARLHYAWKLGSEDAESDTDRSGRVWFQLYKFF